MPPQQASQGPGLFGQMASTAAYVMSFFVFISLTSSPTSCLSFRLAQWSRACPEFGLAPKAGMIAKTTFTKSEKL
jgi:hypothetical protein